MSLKFNDLRFKKITNFYSHNVKNGKNISVKRQGNAIRKFVKEVRILE
jgi:hypothetical protein